MEVGWYLRFAKTDKVEAQVSLKGVDQVRHAMYIHTDWNLEVEEFEDHAVTRFTRKKPRFDKDPEQS